jgi:hypothetical protein
MNIPTSIKLPDGTVLSTVSPAVLIGSTGSAPPTCEFNEQQALVIPVQLATPGRMQIFAADSKHYTPVEAWLTDDPSSLASNAVATPGTYRSIVVASGSHADDYQFNVHPWIVGDAPSGLVITKSGLATSKTMHSQPGDVWYLVLAIAKRKHPATCSMTFNVSPAN